MYIHKIICQACSCITQNLPFIPAALRNLTKDCSNAEGKLQRQTVVERYSNFDSQVYAPKTRIGVYLDSGSEQYNVKSKFTTSLDGQSIG